MLETSVRPDRRKVEFEFAMPLDDKAREKAILYFRKTNWLTWRSDEMPVTLADTEIEKSFRNRVQTRFLEGGIFSVEMGVSGRDCLCIWVVDPIGCTGWFPTGFRLFGVLLCLVGNERAAFGVVDACATSKRWTAQSCMVAALNDGTRVTSGRPLRASDPNFTRH